jgi:lysyl-tRNA synthetase class 2
VRKDIVGPAYLVGHPVEVSPLAKRMKDRSRYTERYQLMIAGSELCNGYSELNDPVDQAERFSEQQEMRDEGDEEAQMHDHDFVRALEYGMPPVTGLGISERLFAFLADKPIRETVLFPLLRPEHGTKKPNKYDYRERKIVAILSKELPGGLAANALGHMAFSAGHYSDESWMGEEKLIDADDGVHTGISRYPFVVLGASDSNIKDIVKKAKDNSDLLVVDYPQEMFDTGDDNDLVKAMSKAKTDKIKYHAVLLVGSSKEVDKLTKDLKLYK